MEYIRCPRCELNYILKKEKLCKVCQSELDVTNKRNDFAPEGMEICPICKVNYINDDEDMCASCAEEKEYEDIPISKGFSVDSSEIDFSMFEEESETPSILDSIEKIDTEKFSVAFDEDDEEDDDEDDSNSKSKFGFFRRKK